MKKFILLFLLSVATLQGQSRSQIQTQIETIATGVPNTALKIRSVLAVLADGTAQTGDVKEIDVSNAYLTANFDASGLGTNERLGWAICNGNNGTRNRGGRVSLQTNSTYPTLGATGGSATHTLTVSEMPSHTHNIAYNSKNAAGGGAERTLDNTGTSTNYNQTQAQGGGQAHNNMQPYIVTLFIMKL